MKRKGIENNEELKMRNEELEEILDLNTFLILNSSFLISYGFLLAILLRIKRLLMLLFS